MLFCFGAVWREFSAASYVALLIDIFKKKKKRKKETQQQQQQLAYELA